jgi:hypothetical protein
MSASLALLTAASVGSQLIGLLTNKQTSSIGPLIPGIVLEEDHDDDLTITDHPVEYGANITDHAFKEPARVTIQCQWSNTQAALLDFSESYILQVYGQLIDLQASRQLITVVTHKRMYYNCLIEHVRTKTTRASAFALPVQIDLRELFLVYTTTTSLPPADQHAAPQQTAPVLNSGQVSSTGSGTSGSSQSALLSGVQATGANVQGFQQ